MDKRTIAEKFGKKKDVTTTKINNYCNNQAEKKISPSKKYAYVKSTLDQGKTMKDVQIISKQKNFSLTAKIGDKLVAKRASEKFFRIKCSTLAKLLTGYNFGESVYNWNGEDGKEEFKLSEHAHDTESIYSMRTDATHLSTVTVTTDQLGITVRTLPNYLALIYYYRVKQHFYYWI